MNTVSATLLTCMEVDIAALGGLIERGIDVLDAVQNAGGLPTADSLSSVFESMSRSPAAALVIVQHVGCSVLALSESFQQLTLKLSRSELSADLASDVAASVAHAVQQVHEV